MQEFGAREIGEHGEHAEAVREKTWAPHLEAGIEDSVHRIGVAELREGAVGHVVANDDRLTKRFPFGVHRPSVEDDPTAIVLRMRTENVVGSRCKGALDRGRLRDADGADAPVAATDEHEIVRTQVPSCVHRCVGRGRFAVPGRAENQYGVVTACDHRGMEHEEAAALEPPGESAVQQMSYRSPALADRRWAVDVQGGVGDMGKRAEVVENDQRRFLHPSSGGSLTHRWRMIGGKARVDGVRRHPDHEVGPTIRNRQCAEEPSEQGAIAVDVGPERQHVAGEIAPTLRWHAVRLRIDAPQRFCAEITW